MQYYAHTSPYNNENGPWHKLYDHLDSVARMANQFAQDALPDCPDFADKAFLAGLLHDLGKYRQEFQEYLHGKRISSPETHHSIYGASAGLFDFNSLGSAVTIAGHHTGLSKVACELKDRISKVKKQVPSLLEILAKDLGEIPRNASASDLDDILRVEVMIRMLFSCLVDADWTDTAQHMQSYQPIHRIVRGN